MGATAAVHPTDQTLQSYGLGKLDDASAESVNKHLESCPDCRRRVAEMSSDSFLGRLRERPGPARFAGSGRLLARWSVDARRGRELARRRRRPTPLPPGLADHPDYEVIRELGQGGMGTVYLARTGSWAGTRS